MNKKLCQALQLSDLTCPIKRLLKWLLLTMVSLFWRETNGHYWCKKNDILKANMAKKNFKIVSNVLRSWDKNWATPPSLFLRKHLQGEIRCFGIFGMKSCGNLRAQIPRFCGWVTRGNVLDENGAMFRVSVTFPLAKMWQLVYYCVLCLCFTL